MQFVSGALGSLLSATRWGRTWVMRGAPPCPGRTIAGCIASDLIWNLLSCTTKSPIRSALTSRKWMRWWLVSSAGSGACGSGKPGSSMPGGDLAALQGDTEAVDKLWAILPLWMVRAGCAYLHGQTAPGRGCSSYIRTRLPCSPGLAATQWSCSLLLTRGYGPLNTNSKHREDLNQLLQRALKSFSAQGQRDFKGTEISSFASHVKCF